MRLSTLYAVALASAASTASAAPAATTAENFFQNFIDSIFGATSNGTYTAASLSAILVSMKSTTSALKIVDTSLSTADGVTDITETSSTGKDSSSPTSVQVTSKADSTFYTPGSIASDVAGDDDELSYVYFPLTTSSDAPVLVATGTSTLITSTDASSVFASQNGAILATESQDDSSAAGAEDETLTELALPSSSSTTDEAAIFTASPTDEAAVETSSEVADVLSDLPASTSSPMDTLLESSVADTTSTNSAAGNFIMQSTATPSSVDVAPTIVSRSAYLSFEEKSSEALTPISSDAGAESSEVSTSASLGISGTIESSSLILSASSFVASSELNDLFPTSTFAAVSSDLSFLAPESSRSEETGLLDLLPFPTSAAVSSNLGLTSSQSVMSGSQLMDAVVSSTETLMESEIMFSSAFPTELQESYSTSVLDEIASSSDSFTGLLSSTVAPSQAPLSLFSTDAPSTIELETISSSLSANQTSSSATESASLNPESLSQPAELTTSISFTLLSTTDTESASMVHSSASSSAPSESSIDTLSPTILLLVLSSGMSPIAESTSPLLSESVTQSLSSTKTFGFISQSTLSSSSDAILSYTPGPSVSEGSIAEVTLGSSSILTHSTTTSSPTDSVVTEKPTVVTMSSQNFFSSSLSAGVPASENLKQTVIAQSSVLATESSSSVSAFSAIMTDNTQSRSATKTASDAGSLKSFVTEASDNAETKQTATVSATPSKVVQSAVDIINSASSKTANVASVTNAPITSSPAQQSPATPVPASTSSGVFKATTSNWVPTRIVVDSKSTNSVLTSATENSGAQNSGLPRAINPAETSVPGEDYSLVTIGFKEGLNYQFVALSSTSSAQIFTYLPQVLSYGFSDQELFANVSVKRIVPYTASNIDYIISVAEVYFPTDAISALQSLVLSPDSKLYNNPDETSDILANLIDSRISLTQLEENTLSTELTALGNGSMDSDGASSTSLNSGTVGGVVVGASLGTFAYMSLMILLFKRFQKKKSIELPPSDSESELHNAAPRTPSSLGSSGERPPISFPVNAQNSLGWTV